MFRYLSLATLLFISNPVFACPMADAAAFARAAEVVQQTEGAKASFKLEGLTCGTCSEKVATELQKATGHLASAVDYQSGRVEIAYDGKKTNIKELEKVLIKTGYKIVEKPEV